MAVLLGAALAIVAGAVVFLGWVALQAALLRALARQLAEVTIGWPAAAVAVVLASVAQSCGSSLLGGLDVGLLGFLVGLAAWSAVVSAIGGLPFEKAMLVGLAMAVVTWALLAALFVGGVLALLGGLAGASLAG